MDRKQDIIVVGVNYHSTPVHVRERFSVSTDQKASVAAKIAQLPHITECVVLSTCNRTEVYAVVTDVSGALRTIESFLLANQSSQLGEPARWFKLLRSDAILHLFRVASGLDSMILGEGQILSQVTKSHQIAIKAGTIGPILDRAFRAAVVCGKRVRTETDIAKRPVSVSSAAIDVAKQLLGGRFNGRNVLVVGAGKMASICVKQLLSDRTVREVKVISRSGNYQSLASCKSLYGDRLVFADAISDKHELAANADLVVVATSASEYVLTAPKLQAATTLAGREVCIMDISVPRNVHPEIASINGVRLYHTDDLAESIEKNTAEQEILITQADEIIFAELAEFGKQERVMVATPTLKKLREKIENIRVERMEKINESGARKADLELITKQLINQILHEPTTNLKSASNLEEMTEAIELLFNLKKSATENKKQLLAQSPLAS